MTVSIVYTEPQVVFQNDASKVALSANQTKAERVSDNQRASSEHHFEN